MELLDTGNFSGAIPKLQAAIRQKNDEGANIKFYGMKFGDYFPHFYLGLAYNSVGNYEAAVNELEISEKQGAIQRKQNLAQRLGTTKTLAKAKLAIKDPQIAENKPPITVPVVVPQQEEKKPVEEEKKPVEVAEVKPEEKPPVQDLPVKPPPEKTPSEKKPEEKIAAVIPEKKPEPEIEIPTLDPNTNVRATMLRNGARKYFEGDYDSAILYLQEVQKISHADAPADFLLGCSYASKYLLTGSLNKKYLDQASIMFRKVKKLNPKYHPKNTTFLSPAVLQIFEKTT
jgi:tetratricopeptide (TPR) repeat protein